MKRVALVGIVLAVAAVGSARAEDKPNPTGTWKWSITFNGQTRERTLKLKLEGDKLTGAVVGRDNKETPIEDAKYKDGNVSFKSTRERDGKKSTSTYSGKVSGDTIKGKIDSEHDGKAESRDWEAKRSKD